MRRLLIVISAFAMTGCAGVESPGMSPAGFLRFAESELTVVTYKKPDFEAHTLGKEAVSILSRGLFGILGEPVIDAGNRVVEKNELADPAPDIAATLAPWATARLGSGPPRFVSGRDIRADDPENLSEIAGNQGLLLDVRTLGWKFDYFWAHLPRYRLIYRVRARLIDANSGEIIGWTPCHYVSHQAIESGDASTYEGLFADDAAFLKTELRAATEYCSRVIKADLFEGELTAIAR